MESHQLCYYVLGLVHSIWSPIPGGLEDFIGSPKTNGYQSLHTRVVPLSILSKNCPLLPMEVQIRTADMDRLADLGVAASNWGVKRPPGRGAPGWAALSGMPAARAGGGGGGAAQQQPDDYDQQQQQQEQQQLQQQQDAAAGGAAGGGARAFWMGLAQYMLETVVAGGTSLAAITGVRPHFGGSPFSSRDDDGSGEHRTRSNGGRGGSPAPGARPASAAAAAANASAPPSPQPAAAAGPGGLVPSALLRQDAAASAASSSSSSPAAAAPDANWLTQMRKWQEEFVGSLSAREFVDGVTAEVLGQSVFVYTHTGELRRLPKGSTVVDFAYSVHTRLGNEMRAALVNGRLVAPSYVLSNGEVVEVRREPAAAAATPSMVRRHEQWVGFVRTRTAKLKIKAFLKEHARRQRRSGGSGGNGGGAADGGSPDGGSVSSCEDDDEACLAAGGGRGGGGGALATASLDGSGGAPAVSVKTLSISCADKMGLLAAVCNIITDSGHNIKSVSALPGRPPRAAGGDVDGANGSGGGSTANGLPAAGAGEYVMTFVLKGKDDRLGAMVAQIMALEGVATYSVSCELPHGSGGVGGGGAGGPGGGARRGGASQLLSAAVGLWAAAVTAAAGCGGGGGWA